MLLYFVRKKRNTIILFIWSDPGLLSGLGTDPVCLEGRIRILPLGSAPLLQTISCGCCVIFERERERERKKTCNLVMNTDEIPTNNRCRMFLMIHLK